MHVKFVLLLLPSGSNRVTGQLNELPSFTSDKTVSDEISKILATSTKKKKVHFLDRLRMPFRQHERKH